MSAEASFNLSGEADPEGAKVDPAFQRDEHKEAPATRRVLSKPWKRRRERWGKLDRKAMCPVCRRLLLVNWTRSYPCLFCDRSVDEMRSEKERDRER